MQTIMGEVTTIAKASSNYASLRTVIPMSIVKQWDLKEGDKLDWSWEVRNNEMFVAIKRVMGDQQQTHKQQRKSKKNHSSKMK